MLFHAQYGAGLALCLGLYDWYIVHWGCIGCSVSGTGFLLILLMLAHTWGSVCAGWLNPLDDLGGSVTQMWLCVVGAGLLR